MELIRLLLEYGADVTAKDNDVWTTLHHLAQKLEGDHQGGTTKTFEDRLVAHSLNNDHQKRAVALVRLLLEKGSRGQIASKGRVNHLTPTCRESKLGEPKGDCGKAIIVWKGLRC